jgi:ABC-type Na+ transport system ATPase subunit NatA
MPVRRGARFRNRLPVRPHALNHSTGSRSLQSMRELDSPLQSRYNGTRERFARHYSRIHRQILPSGACGVASLAPTHCQAHGEGSLRRFFHSGGGGSGWILATLIIPTRGRATIGGFDVERNGAQARKQFGYHTGGDEGFYTRLTARENLLFFASMNNITGARACERISRISTWLGLGQDLDRQVRTLSTGMTHRLGLGRAMLHEPGILLLDEPTRSLDPLAASDFRRLLKAEIVRREGTTLLFASHTPREVEEIADRVVLLDEGRVVANETPQGLCSTAGTRTLDEAIGRLVRQPAHAESLQ